MSVSDNYTGSAYMISDSSGVAEITNDTLNEMESSFTSWYITYLVVSSINTLFHGLSCILLMVTYKRKRTSQHLLLFNLSLCELLLNLCVTTEFTLQMCLTNELLDYSDVSMLQLFIQNLHFTAILYLYFSAMFLIAADRLAATLLNIRYTIYDIRYKVVCTIRRTKVTIVCVWLFLLAVACALLAYNYSIHAGYWLYKAEKYFKIFVVYIPTAFASFYLVFALVCFTIMFIRYLRISNISSHLTTSQMFRSSKYYVSILLMTSFLFLMVIPFLIYTFIGDSLPPSVVTAVGMMTYISDTVHFIICIFVYDPVSTWLKKTCFVRGSGWRIEAGLLSHRMAPGCEHWSGPGPHKATTTELVIQSEESAAKVVPKRKIGTARMPNVGAQYSQGVGVLNYTETTHL